MDQHERLRIFFEELENAASAETGEGARLLVEQILNRIEDRFSGAEFNPSNWRNDGRMYPPQDDKEVESPFPNVRAFKAKGHYLLLGNNGAIKVVSATHAVGSPDAKVWLDKPGIDGRCCP